MKHDGIAVGDPVSDSPVGPGTVTGITEAGYPQVNNVAVAWLARPDGARFDPHNKRGGTCHGDPAYKEDECVRDGPPESVLTPAQAKACAEGLEAFQRGMN